MPRVASTGRVVSSERVGSPGRSVSSTRVEESPLLSVASTAIWIRPDPHLIVKDDAGGVIYTQDQSPVPWSGTQSVSTRRPTVVNDAAFNNRPVFILDGVDDFLNCGLVTKSSSHTLIVVARKVNAAVTSKTLCAGANVSGSSVNSWIQVSCETSGQLTVGFSNGTNSRSAWRASAGSLVSNTPFIFSVTYSGSGSTFSSMQVNGVEQTQVHVASSSLSVGGTPEPFSLGRYGAFVGGDYWDGTIAEFFLTNVALSIPQVQFLQRYLGNYYGIKVA